MIHFPNRSGMRKEGASTSKTIFLHLPIARKCEYRISEFPSSQTVVTRKKLLSKPVPVHKLARIRTTARNKASAEINYC